ncbi:GIY-YIG nuclease family protein [Trichococcus collinsii]|nr:GIY-YIG nuclease family protein [Trichococcus collinsii]
MASSEHYFYVLHCADDSFYAGYTTDTLRREQEHNKGIGSKYTKARRPVQMIYNEVFGSRTEATKAEAAFKKLSRKQKENFLKVHGTHLPGSELGGI